MPPPPPALPSTPIIVKNRVQFIHDIVGCGRARWRLVIYLEQQQKTTKKQQNINH